VGVCAKGIKKELNTLDEADFVRDVANSDYHLLFPISPLVMKRGFVNADPPPPLAIVRLAAGSVV
jgi:hypothetical protein